MDRVFTPLDDTIAALATPPGRSALALIRVSGREATRVLRAVAPEVPAEIPRRHPFLAAIRDARGNPIDRALVTFFPAPDSATGEDVVEVSLHGSPPLLHSALEALAESGARPARPGEFTERAFLRGKVDLVQAEAVRDLIEARTDEAVRASARRLDGGLSRLIGGLREGLARAAAELAATIDFSEDVGEAVLPATREAVAGAAAGLRRLADTAERGRLLGEGARVVFLGRPNAGKSTLFNALAGSDRAIVTDVPGTTRDTLDAAIDLEGIPVALVDTAGLRRAEDPVEQAGVARARQAAEDADAIVFVFDASAGWTGEDRSAIAALSCPRTLFVANKIDLRTGGASVGAPEDAIEICGLAADAGARLRASLAALLGAGPPGEALSDLVGSVRQRDLIARAAAAAEDARAGLDRGESPEYPAARIDEALAAMADLFGETTPDDVLRRVFATFCIGK